jgi:hypothetical protein
MSWKRKKQATGRTNKGIKLHKEEISQREAIMHITVKSIKEET